MSAPVDDVVRKIQKLLSLANSSNEAEAALAMARAQELLAKRNLDYAVVRDATVAGGTVAPAPEKREKTRINRSAQYRWQRELWAAIAEANFCWHWVAEVREVLRHGRESKIRVRRHMLLGRESNVAAVRVMGEYLTDTIERMLPYPNTERLSRSAISWRRGCADRLIERLQEQAKERKQASENTPSDSTALVLRSVYENEYAANYDAQYGTGRYAQKLLEDAQWEAAREERERLAQVEREKAEREWLEYLASETPQQKRAREKEEAKETLRREREWARTTRSWRREQQAEAAKVDQEAYYSGKAAGGNIGLGGQLGEGRTRKERALSCR